MKVKKLLSGLTALAIAATSFAAMTLNVGAAVPESVYIGYSEIYPGQYMNSNQEILEGDNYTVGEDDCAAYLSPEGVLTLGGAMTVYEGRYSNVWGAVAADSGEDLNIDLLPNADVKLVSASYSGMYAYRAPINIGGEGKLSIETKDSSKGGLLFYRSGGVVPHITITDGANVTITGTKGIAFDGSVDPDANLYVTNGAVLTIDVEGAAFAKAPVIEDGSAVLVGTSEADAAAWDNSMPLTSYSYVKITAPGGSAEPDPEPTPDIPVVTPSPTPTATATTEPGEVTEVENPTPWIGVQAARDKTVEWYYNDHYLMDDGNHYNKNETPYPDFVKGMETMYFTTENALAEFNKDVTIYGVSSELSKYYGSGIASDFANDKDLVIHLNNGVNVTIDATDRGSSNYLYGLYLTGHLIIEGSGTLTIKSDGGTSDSAALCVFNGKDVQGSGDVTIKDNVKLILENNEANGYGINVYGLGAGDIKIEDNASVEATGGLSAISKAPVISGEQKIYVGSSAADAAEWDGETDISTYKYVNITSESVEPAPSTPTPSPTPTATATAAPTEAPTPEPSPENVPDSGVVVFDDYEYLRTYDWGNYPNIAPMRKANGGIYQNVFRLKVDIGSDGHGKVLNSDTTISDAVGFYYSIKDHYGLSKEYNINEGRLIISSDWYVPGNMEYLNNGETASVYMTSYTSDGWAGTASDGRAHLYRIVVPSGASQAQIYFNDQSNPANNVLTSSATNTVNLEFDKWYNVETVIDYDAGTVSYYVDGVWAAASNAVPDDVLKCFTMAYMQLAKSGKANSTTENPVIFSMDNFKIEHDSPELEAKISEVGSNYAEVEFARPIDLKNGITASLAALDGSASIAASSYEQTGYNTVKFNFDGVIESGRSYELVFDGDVRAAYGDGKIAAGSGVIFAAPAAKQTTELINLDFDDNSIGNAVLTHQNADNTAFVDEAERTGDYASVEDGVLVYDHYMDVSGEERNGLKFPFKDGMTVDKGVITVEFDAAVRGDASRTRAMYGLYDPNKTDVSWSSATVFGGISPYDGNRMSFAKSSADYRTRTAADSSMEATVALLKEGDMHHYKYEIDLDTNTYKIYYDGSLVEELDYFPGGAADNSFDAFVMSGLYYSEASGDRGQTFLLLDNLKVTAETSSPAVSGVSFVKYDNSEAPYAREVSSGTKQIKIAFTKAMAQSVTDCITIDGLTADDYSVSYDNNTAVIDLAKYLAPSTSYTLRISAGAQAADGGTIGAAAAYIFTTDSGEVIYNKPVIKVNGEAVSELPEIADGDIVTAELTVINTTGETAKCWMSLAGYDGENCMTSIKPLEASAEPSKTSVIVLTADTAAVKDAERLGTFVFDGLSALRPLTECTKVSK
ncbi:MAG TPA: Ig-like domain-containing protein [Candidatus Ornithomonoglobus intestinigallinarum]|uniref:Ig-like domain-containing protein n=1 Tax=Candidatus Ornithomonoglobus intestinigallinarum TaxID=2840894 RepID=A0A9D1H3Y3_9FIRM|nr:Ig-like domain-containing protein [Candidatus Ornithomonoglobus intestinigallinarum]